MIIAWSVPYVDKDNHEIIDVVAADGSKTPKTVFKRARKQKYINIDLLSATDKIFVDIALKAQSLMDDPSYLISLKDLFVEGDWTDIHYTELNHVLTTDYYEDANGNPISYNEYCEEWLGLPKMITTYSGLHVPQNISQETAKNRNIIELIDFTEEDFSLSDTQINLLNRFLNGVIELQNSSLCIQHKAFSLRCGGSKFHLKENISEEQYKASIISFRKLYMNDEPASLKKAVDILQDRRFMPDCVVKAINSANAKYNQLLNKKLKDYMISFRLDEQTKDIRGDKKCADLVTVMFNVNCIHQGNSKTLALKQEIEQVIPDSAVQKFLLWCLLLDLQHPIAVVAQQAYRILNTLGKLKFLTPVSNISNAEHSFQIYIVNKVYELAEVIWNENGRDICSMMFYRDTALTKIVERFSLNRDLFKDLLSPLDYSRALKDKKYFDNISNMQRNK